MGTDEAPKGWRLVKLSDLGEVNRGRSRHRPRHSSHLYGGPYPFIQTGDIKASGGRITSHQQCYSEAGLAQSRLWPSGTMCITIAANIAETAILTYPACFPDSVIGFIADPALCDAYFIELMFRHLRRHIQHIAEDGGTVQDNINLEFLENFQFALPSLPEQREIARVLGMLDDKIELNRQMVTTLDGLTRALFRSWFVDFDPVIAKAAGRRPVGITAEIAGHFPKSFSDSTYGPIPKGWKTEPLGKHFEAIKGLSYKGQGLSDSGVPLHNLNSVLEGGGYKYTGIKWYTGEFKDRHLVRPGDVIVANTEQGHDCLLLGYAAIVPESLGNTAIYSHHLFRLSFSPATPLTPEFVCQLLNSEATHDTVSGYGNGTTVNMLPADALAKPEFVRPPDQLMRKYTEIAQKSRRRGEQLVMQNRTLDALREALLPRLLSGELRLKDAEKIADRA